MPQCSLELVKPAAWLFALSESVSVKWSMALFSFSSNFSNVHDYQNNLAWSCCMSPHHVWGEKSPRHIGVCECGAVSRYWSRHALQLYNVIVLFCNSSKLELGCFRDFIPPPTQISLWFSWAQAILILLLMHTENIRCFLEVPPPPPLELFHVL